MLEIKNIDKIKNKVIGSTGYYIDKIQAVELLFTNEPSSHFYHIELTNRKAYIIVRLDRVAGWNGMYELSKGVKKVHIGIDELKDMKGLIDWMGFLLEGKTGIVNHINQSGTTIQI